MCLSDAGYSFLEFYYLWRSFMKKNRKFLILAFVLFVVGFLMIYSQIIFYQNENSLVKAAKRYFELNPSELPTGKRIKTLSLVDLYHQSYLKKDLYIPYTQKSCSLSDSWVKVKKENGEYQYYTYLKCGIFSSGIDHEGPEIQLNGESKIQISKGEEYVDPGVKSVKDNVDGKIDTSKVTIKNNLDTSSVGTYEITYTAYDSLNNKSVVKRQIQVVQTLYSTVKEKLGDASHFKGEPTDNYIRLSNMIFRIYGVDEDNNIVIVSNDDVSYVNYTKLDEWLDYYYQHLNENAQKMIVEKAYCNETLSEENLKTTSCNSYTKKKKVYIPSIMEMNQALEDNYSFVKSSVISWTANKKSDDEVYVAQKGLLEQEYIPASSLENFGVRPMMTIKGSSLLTGGVGTIDNPYIFGDVKKAKAGTLLNERETGEYISIEDDIYRIVDTEKDGTTKVISDFTIGDDNNVFCTANEDSDYIVYDPKDSTSVAYFINNRVSAYINIDYFVNHEVVVPIYQDKIIYNTEVQKKKYNVKLSAPNMYEMFSCKAARNSSIQSYWFINSSKEKRITGVLNGTAPIIGEISKFQIAYVRIIAYVKGGTMIENGDGTYESPYLIK